MARGVWFTTADAAFTAALSATGVALVSIPRGHVRERSAGWDRLIE